MQTTEGYDGKKDKKNEKNSSFPQELAPHFSDTVDYYLYFKYLNKNAKKAGRKRLVSAV